MTLTEYRRFIDSKRWTAPACGFTATVLPDALFPFQRVAVQWACRKGRAALFEDCGLGKTLQQVVWSANVHAHTGGNALILAPLAVADQTAAEAARFGFTVTHVREPEEVTGPGIYITNYGRAERFLALPWAGIVLDESSILKASDGSTRGMLIDQCAEIPYRLACTATPSPNDFAELGNHAEFLGVMTRTEMLASFFVHDGGDTASWRLKGHAESEFWRWVAGWAIMLRRPSDLGFSDGGFAMPALRIVPHILDSGIITEGTIFAMPARTLEEQRAARKQTLTRRCQAVADLVNADAEPWLVWCELNEEGDTLAALIHDAVQVAGADDDEAKESRMLGFAAGAHRVLVTKPKIAGYGMNWQHCARMAFVGVSHSYEQFYQAVRRCWRFGQRRPVDVHVFTTDVEAEIMANIQRKQDDADRMAAGMVAHMSEITKADIQGSERQEDGYRTGDDDGERFNAYLGDCVEGIASLPDDHVGYSIFSPPFASLYTYSNSPFDMGNAKDGDEFIEQFRYLVRELLRVTMPGRLLSFHVMNLPSSKERDGYIGIKDFRGELIRTFVEAGWIYHSEVCIWKDPVTAMQRTKALGLLHKTIRKDSCMSRQGIADYLVTMRKPGTNPEPVSHGDDLPVSLWQQYASPVWMDINPSDTLQKESARDEQDERHICPLQLEVIRRAMHLWSKPDDLVLSPFMGIGSEGYVALKMGRRFIGYELKPSYFVQAVANLRAAEEHDRGQTTLADLLGSPK